MDTAYIMYVYVDSTMTCMMWMYWHHVYCRSLNLYLQNCRYIFYGDKVHFCKQTEEVYCCTLYNHAFHDRQYTLKKNSHSCTKKPCLLPCLQLLTLITDNDVCYVGNFTRQTFVMFPQTSALTMHSDTNISIYIKSPQHHIFMMVQIFSDNNQTEGSKST